MLPSQHRKTHDRPYKCSICPKSFALSADCKRHMASHRNPPSIFTCPSPGCNFRGTTRADHLLRHARRVHKTEDWRIQIKRNVIEAKGRKDRTTVDDLDLLGAAFQGNVEKLEELILAGGNIAVTDNMGSTLLHFGSSAGSHAIVKLLLESGACVIINECDNWGTPLHNAAANGHDAAVKLLLQHGARTNVRNFSCRTPLHKAAENGHNSVVKLLLQYGADTNAKRYYVYQTPLHAAAANGHDAVVKLLLQHSAHTNNGDNSCQTPLYTAAMRGHEAVVKRLLQHGADINAKSCCEQTPLYKAVNNGHMAVVKLLLQHGVNSQKAIVKLLHEKGAYFREGEQNLSTDMCTDCRELWP
jgi:ankyrin repeat protein